MNVLVSQIIAVSIVYSTVCGGNSPGGGGGGGAFISIKSQQLF